MASRSERAILHDMAALTEHAFQLQEAREIMGELLEVFEDMPDVLDRMLATEAHVDVTAWRRRLRTILHEEHGDGIDQSDLFD